MSRISLLAALLASAMMISAQAPKTTRPKVWDTGWQSLFNEKDLTGWVPVGHEKWTVEDGIIHGSTLTKDYGYLQTAKDYKDFHLALRFKCVGDGNSGVFFHTDFKPGTAEGNGMAPHS